MKMALKDITHLQNLLTAFNVLVFVAHNCVSLFFPLYLKYLELSVLEMSVIRAFQVLITMAVIPLSVSLMKLKICQAWRTYIICSSLIASSGVCVILAFYLQTSANVDLMRCGNIINPLSFSQINNYDVETATPSNKTVQNFSSVLSEVHSTISSQKEITRMPNFIGVPTSGHSTSTITTKPSSVPNFEFQFQGIPTSRMDNMNHTNVENIKPLITNKYSTSNEELSTTAKSEKMSSLIINVLYIRPTIPSEVNEIELSDETDFDENLEDIFAAPEDPPKKPNSHRMTHKDSDSKKYPEYSQATNSDSGSEINTITANFKNMNMNPLTNVIDFPLFIKNYSRKPHGRTTHLTHTAHQNSRVLDFPVRAEFPVFTTGKHEISNKLPGLDAINNFNSTEDETANWQPAPETNNNGGYANIATTVPVTPQTLSNFAAGHFQKIMDFLNHHRAHADRNRKSWSDDKATGTSGKHRRKNFQSTYSQDGPRKHFKKNSKFSLDDLDSFEDFPLTRGQGLRLTAGAGTLPGQQRRLRRKVPEGALLVPEKTPAHRQNDYAEHGKGNASATGMTPGGPEGSDDVWAEPVPARGMRVFAVAAVLAAAFELASGVAPAAARELWGQLRGGAPTPSRLPLQLGAWSAGACLLLLAAASLPCRLQAAVHCCAAGTAFALALVPALASLPAVVRRARPSEAGLRAEGDAAPGKRLEPARLAARFASGALTACSSEFMLWHVASLGGFPLDYELLYCGYAALGALAEAAVRRGGGGRGGGLGAALLAAHFGAGAALGPAWWSLAVAPLAGAGSALLRPDEDDAVRPAPRDLGHALGCLAGGALAHGLGTAALFRACAAASCAWCVVSVACRGVETRN